MSREHIAVSLAVLIVIAGAATAAEDWAPGIRGVGPRIGITTEPDQLHLGAHMDFGNFARHVRFQPNIEVGVGDSQLLFTANAEAAYRFATRWEAWSPYAGGGLGVRIRDLIEGPGGSDSDLGLSVLGGIERGHVNGGRFFMELKLGLVDAPDAKATIGWTFHP